MKRSVERILTTHTGSLPRPPEVVKLIHAREDRAAERETFEAAIRDAVTAVVAKQKEVGIDVVNDGEFSKVSYAAYVKDRLGGFEGEGTLPRLGDLMDFPEFGERLYADFGDALDYVRTPACIGPIFAQQDNAELRRDIANLQNATEGADPVDVFMSAASPGVIALFFANEYYATREDYLAAIADAMREEYKTIAAAGFVLQLDCPDLAMGRHIQFDAESLDEFKRQARLNVEALNYATAEIDPEQMRIHICWGNYEGPHHHDVALRDIIEIVLQASATGIVLEACNPRHDHEWAVFEEVTLPEGKVLIPGVIDSTNNYIEHSELIAQRLTRYASLVGQENVIAGSDCGFGTFAGNPTVDPKIAWAKLQAMSEGADLATRRLRTHR
jgi:5-methyltetrahydropteroyltriglutamate--homocysteine methyltransferase